MPGSAPGGGAKRDPRPGQARGTGPAAGFVAGGSRWVAVSSRRKSWAVPKFNSGSDGR